MNDPADRIPTGDQQDTTVDADRTDGTRQDTTVAPTVTVPEAARILEVSTDAVRSRLRRGTLEGGKIAGEWHVPLAALHDTRQDAQPSPTGSQRDATGAQQEATVDRQAGQPDPDRTPTVVDLAPLTQLIERQAQEVQRLTEAATMWQMRARQFEDQLKQLSAGETPPTTLSEAPGSPRGDDQPVHGLRAWWRRLWGF
jgi:hypothetical protein